MIVEFLTTADLIWLSHGEIKFQLTEVILSRTITSSCLTRSYCPICDYQILSVVSVSGCNNLILGRHEVFLVQGNFSSNKSVAMSNELQPSYFICNDIIHNTKAGAKQVNYP